jgi:alkylation response protein AidB-like acyl-CoA dehydrogenase
LHLDYTSEQQAFRAEVRAWPQGRAPKERLASFDTAEGFEAHRAWEAELNAGRWSAVTWPEEYGGRGLDLIRWHRGRVAERVFGAPLDPDQTFARSAA